MGLLGSLLNGKKKEITEGVIGIVDKISAPDQAKQKLKTEMVNMLTSKINDIIDLQSQVIQTEMKGNWLQRSWRPLVMLTFTAIIVIGAFTEIPYLETTSPFWELLKLGIGGYVVGRSVEKIADTATKNIDLPFLKKKDRKL